MPRPHHRLNLYAVPVDPDRVPRGLITSTAWQHMVQEGWILPSGQAGPEGHLLVAGGFSRVRLDEPGRRTVFGNRLGGFSVTCPACGAGLVRVLSATVTRWRTGADETSVECPSCGQRQGLFEIQTNPGIALGSFALEWRDVQSPELTELGRSTVENLLGGECRVVLSRG